MLGLTGGIFVWACIFSSLSVLIPNKLNPELIELSSVDKFKSPEDENRVVTVESESFGRRIFDDMSLVFTG